MKKFLSLLLLVTLLLPFAGCAKPAPQEEAPATSTVSQYPLTVTDQAGRTVTIEEEPQRLVSCYYITSSLLMALELDEKMVGIEDNPEYRPIYERSAPHLLELPWVGTAKVLDLEGCAALEPDLVILPLRLKDSAQTLEELGIDVLLVNPESRELLHEMIRLVATATDTQERAQSLLNFIEIQEIALQDALTDAEKPTVYLAGNSNFLSTAGDAMYQSDLLRLAGGTNVAAAIEETYWAEIDYEQLLTWNPEYIILPSASKCSVEDVLSDPNLSDCQAVVNGKVYQLPNDAEAWDSPVPSSFLGAVWLANVLHPDKISEADSLSLMNEYYELFYDFTYRAE